MVSGLVAGTLARSSARPAQTASLQKANVVVVGGRRGRCEAERGRASRGTDMGMPTGIFKSAMKCSAC